MTKKLRAIGTLFNPIIPALGFAFLSITTLHLAVPALVSLKIELLMLLATLGTGFIYFLSHRDELSKVPISIWSLFSICLLYTLLPAATSLANQEELGILKNPEYSTLVKGILFGISLSLLLSISTSSRFMLSNISHFYVIYAFYFFFRYFVLGEARDFDLRPALKIRHGDANFMATFFAMMTPIPLYLFKTSQSRISAGVYALSFAALAAATLVTQSRMGIIALAVGLVYIFAQKDLWRLSRAKIFSLLALISVIGLSAYGDKIYDRFTQIQDKSNVDRVSTLQNGFIVYFNNPIWGSGFHEANKFFFENTGYPPFQSEFKELEVHNTFLEIAAELGSVGLFVFAAILLLSFKLIQKANPTARVFLQSSFIILLLSYMTIGIAYKDLMFLQLFILTGYAISARSKEPQHVRS
jgi:O-antigen ligase